MEYIDKIKTIRENIGLWLKHWDGNDGFSYLIQDFATKNEETGETNIYITKGEHREILDYLSERKEIEIINEERNIIHSWFEPRAKR